MKESTIKKYKLIVDEWFANGKNGIEAVKKFYPDSAYSTLATTWQNLAKNSKLQEYIASKERKLSEEADVKVKDVLRLLKNVVTADPLDFMEFNDVTIENEFGESKSLKVLQVKDLKALPIQVRRVISSIEPSRDGIKIKFYDKLKAVEIINKMLGFNHDSEKPKDTVINYANMSVDDLEERIEKIMKLRSLNDK